MPASLGLLALAVAIPAVASTPPPSSDDAWVATDATVIPLDGTAAALSPDGRLLAGVGHNAAPNGGPTICVWEVAATGDEPVGCHDEPLSIAHQLRFPTMRWSPDSTRVAFDLDAVLNMIDSDVLVFDVTTGELVDLTDDGAEGGLFDLISNDDPTDSAAPAPEDIPADIRPTWSPDGSELVFSRSTFDGDTSTTTIMRMPADGGEVVPVVDVDDDAPFTVWMPIHWLDDGSILYTRAAADPDDTSNGLWTVPADGGEPQLLIAGTVDDPIPVPLAYDVAGGTASLFSPLLVGDYDSSYEDSLYWLADLDTGTTTPLPAVEIDGETAYPVTPAALSPDGSTAIAGYRPIDGELRLATIDVADLTVTTLDVDSNVTIDTPYWLEWATPDRVLVSTTAGAVVVTLAAP